MKNPLITFIELAKKNTIISNEALKGYHAFKLSNFLNAQVRKMEYEELIHQLKDNEVIDSFYFFEELDKEFYDVLVPVDFVKFSSLVQEKKKLFSTIYEKSFIKVGNLMLEEPELKECINEFFTHYENRLETFLEFVKIYNTHTKFEDISIDDPYILSLFYVVIKLSPDEVQGHSFHQSLMSTILIPKNFPFLGYNVAYIVSNDVFYNLVNSLDETSKKSVSNFILNEQNLLLKYIGKKQL